MAEFKTTLICSTCKQEKPVSFFYSIRRKTGRTGAGRKQPCKLCAAQKKNPHIEHLSALEVIGPSNGISKTCVTCNNPIDKYKSESHPNMKFCSVECRERGAEKIKIESRMLVSRSSKGALAELLVCADLISRGFYVFRSVSPSAPFDLTAYDGNKMLRFEVTMGTLYKDGALHYPHHRERSGHFEHIAVVVGMNKIIYVPEFAKSHL